MGLAALERPGVKRTVLSLLFCSVVLSVRASELPAQTNQTASVFVVVGAPGEKEFGQVFESSAKLWEKACETAKAQFTLIGLDPAATNDLDRLKAALDAEPKEGDRELWFVLIGHGTFDGKEAKFNLRGPDLTVTNLNNWLGSFQRPMAVIDCTSASSPFLNKLAGRNRVVISATRSGYEQNFARFGQYFAAAISNQSADLDKDGQVSLLEAFLMASRQTTEYYKTEGRLSTEHALLDDNGDGLGTPPDWFRGVRAVKKPAKGASLDGIRAHQWHLIRSEDENKLSPALRARRNELEISITQLREMKEEMPADEYYQRLESLLLDLARLYESSDHAQ